MESFVRRDYAAKGNGISIFEFVIGEVLHILEYTSDLSRKS